MLLGGGETGREVQTGSGGGQDGYGMESHAHHLHST